MCLWLHYCCAYDYPMEIMHKIHKDGPYWIGMHAYCVLYNMYELVFQIILYKDGRTQPLTALSVAIQMVTVMFLFINIATLALCVSKVYYCGLLYSNVVTNNYLHAIRDSLRKVPLLLPLQQLQMANSVSAAAV